MKTRYFSAAPAVSLVYYPQPAGHLTPEALREQFAKLGRNDPLWQALMQLLQERLANATVASAQRDENAPGRIEELISLSQQLAAFRDGQLARGKRPS